MKRIGLVAAFFLSALGAGAAPLTCDLGQGLPYYRASEVPADLPPAAAAMKKGCVLDLRFAHGDTAAGTALTDWLKRHASPKTPVIVLANVATSPELRAALTPHDPSAGVMVIGGAAPGFEPDLGVKIGVADERRAYDALAEGVSLTILLTDNPDKVRNDEASLSRDRLAEASADAVADAKRSAPPPVDAVLQRAVHVHRALVALKKI